jgi:hypothetical protein
VLKQLTFAGRLVSAAALLILLVACIGTAPAPQENITTEKGVQKGDLVTINFELYFDNGTLVDSNNPELIEELIGSPYVRGFAKGPYTFVLGQSGKVKGFDDVIVGMTDGQTKEQSIEPSEPEITLLVNKTQTFKREIFIPRLQSFPISSYDKVFNKRPIVGDVVQNKTLQFKYQIVNITDKYAIGKILAKEGDAYTLQSTYWPSKVLKVANEDILFFQVPTDNQTAPTPFGNATVRVHGSSYSLNYNPEMGKVYNYSRTPDQIAISEPFIVTEIADDSFTLKRFGLLTDKKLKLNVELVSHVPDVKEVRNQSVIKSATVTTQ